MVKKVIVPVTKEQENELDMHEELVGEVKELQAEQRKTNRLLEQLIAALAPIPAPSVASATTLNVNTQKTTAKAAATTTTTQLEKAAPSK